MSYPDEFAYLGWSMKTLDDILLSGFGGQTKLEFF